MEIESIIEQQIFFFFTLANLPVIFLLFFQQRKG